MDSKIKKIINQSGPFSLPDLPYDKAALEPHISGKQLEIHHQKHHAAYITNLNNLTKGTEMEGQDLETIIRNSSGRGEAIGIFNNAAQIWNHTFFWYCLKPNGGGKPKGALLAQIEKDFGGFDKFAADFKATAASQFGSGWGWLVWDGKSLKIAKTGNADLPLVHQQVPLLTIDVWEHSYYLDYQNRRVDYLNILFDHLINWDFVEANFAAR
ncbi:MAG: superoxide dismutase [Proteobacteria bacterium]|nr:superoxide dismutase [Pseudomonadota bacterium]